MLEVLLGGILGVVATLAGVWATEWFARRKERAERVSEVADALKIVGVYLVQERARLSDETSSLSDPAPIEALRIKGYLSDLPAELLTDLVSLHGLLIHINESIELHRHMATAVISSGAPEKWGNWDGIIKEAKQLRREAVTKTESCLSGINRLRQDVRE